MAQLKSAIGGIPVQQAMITDFKTLHRYDSLERAVELTLAGSQKDFPMVDNGDIEGVLTQTDLMKALREKDRHPAVAAVIQKEFVTVDSLEMLEIGYHQGQRCKCTVAVNARAVWSDVDDRKYFEDLPDSRPF